MQENKRNNKKYYLLYTIAFIVSAALIYSIFIKNNKSFVYTLYGDGHICFNSLVYYGRWLRSIGMTLLQEHRLCIPLWDMSVGYGSDIITTFNWMTLGDPLNLLAVFFSADSTEKLYGFLAILRLYLAGLTFSVFALYHKNEKLPVLAGSLIYAFCGFALFAGVRDVYFMSPMIYLPLLCMGVDKIFKKERPYLFIMITALAGVTNFYYFFMLTIWVFIYGVYRYFMLFGKEGLKLSQIGGWLIRCICYYLIGVSMASVLLIPIILQLFGSERFANQDYVPLLYSFDYYWKLLVRFVSTESMEAWTHLGFAPICLTAVMVLFFKKEKKYRPYKVAFIMCIIFMMFPIVGSLMNAGSYVVNRWVWAFSMLVAYIFVKMWPELFNLSKREKLWIMLLSVLYVAICMLRTEFRTMQLTIMMVILLIGVLAILAGDYLERNKCLWKYILLGCVFLGVIANGILRFVWFGSNYAAGFVERGKAWNLVHDNLPSRELENFSDSDVVRYDSLGNLEPMYNTAMNHDLNSTDFYFSLADGTITRYFDELNVNVEMEHRYKGVDERTILERLAGVKYCIAGNDSAVFVPYGYNDKIVETENYAIYENKNALSLGYTYDTYFPYEEYEKLDAVQKQQVLMQCAVIDTNEENVVLSKESPIFIDEECNIAIEAEEGIEIQNNKITVTDKKSIVKLQIDAKQNSEIYLVLDGIVYEKRKEDSGQSKIFYTRNNCTKEQILYTPEHPFYHGRDDFIINLGYNEKAEKVEVLLQFAEVGVYNFDEISVLAQPMDKIDEQTAMLMENELENINVDTNQISGTISLGREKILCVAVPYSKGWTAYVDGNKTETKCLNGVYVGFEVTPGKHDVVMKYRTPGLYVGLLLGLMGICFFIGVVVYWEKGRKNRINSNY